MGTQLCRAAIDDHDIGNSTENDKAERQAVLQTVWRSATFY